MHKSQIQAAQKFKIQNPNQTEKVQSKLSIQKQSPLKESQGSTFAVTSSKAIMEKFEKKISKKQKICPNCQKDKDAK